MKRVIYSTEWKKIEELFKKENIRYEIAECSYSPKEEGFTDNIININKKLENSFLEALNLVVKIQNISNPEISRHCVSVGDLSKKIGQKMGLSRWNIIELEVAARFHDIAQKDSDIDIQNLSLDELVSNREHVKNGEDLLELMSVFKNASIYIRDHHENYDGTGFMNGLKGDEITLGGRIIHLADKFDMLVYKNKTHSELEGIKELKKGSGKEYDPQLIRALEEIIEEKNIYKTKEAMEIDIENLKTGDIIARNIYDNSGKIVLSSGEHIDDEKLKLLKELDSKFPIIDGIFIYNR